MRGKVYKKHGSVKVDYICQCSLLSKYEVQFAKLIKSDERWLENEWKQSWDIHAKKWEMYSA